MPARKRAREEMEDEDDGELNVSLLDQVRNMWEFAALMQYIHFFGDVVKVDRELDVEVLSRVSAKSSDTAVQQRACC